MKQVMILIISFLIIVTPTFAVQPGKILILDLTYDQGKITITNLTEADGFYPQEQGGINEYLKYEIYDGKNNKIFSIKRGFTPNILFDNFDNVRNGDLTGGMIKRDYFNFSVILPYINKSTEIVIKDKTDKIIAREKIKETKKSEIWPIILKVLITLSIIMILIILMLILKKRPQNR